MTAPQVLLLDTNILIHLVRDNRIGRSIDARFQDLFQNAVAIVDLSDEILRTYAEVDELLQRKGRPIEQNDIWIAATAVASGAHLLTTDKDFDPLYPKVLDRTWINPQQPDA